MARRELLTVRGLTVWLPGADEPVLDGVDLDLAAGECVAVVGPSGCGKSTLCRALLDLLPAGSRRRGEVTWHDGRTLSDPVAWRRLRGRGLGLMLQDHRHSLDPVRTIGDQIAEVVDLHRVGGELTSVNDEVLGLLERIRLPIDLAHRYPHQLSGGQRQRANLAATLAARPAVLLADEPTTALDLPVQREILDLLVRLVRDDDLGLLLVTHDQSLVPLLAEQVVELGSEPPPTAEAGATVPAPDVGCEALEVRDLVVSVRSGTRRKDVVKGVSLTLPAGRTLGLAGESGSGKTTLVRAVAGWLEPRAGEVLLSGQAARGRRLVQLVSQDPAAALDPLQTAEAAVLEAARLVDDRATARHRARELMAAVDLDRSLAGRRPHELSGGQRQRLVLARALAVRPRFLLADEPASSLDPPRRQQLLDLLARLQHEYGLGLLLVSHDLDLLARRCDRIAVLDDGLVVEIYAPAEHGAPRHPLACNLAAAAPCRLDRQSLGRPGHGAVAPEPPVEGPKCPYCSRCEWVVPACKTALPPLITAPDGRLLRCPVRTPRGR